ncbi:AAA family ATPase [Acidovorax sp. Be4]|uniref:AAA family ATPase n=1 Tax=Acidovorax bellezanensis TaxID=2976702 RepID=A0ABT2PP68_9BURK|nr:AAA family ATPase [Acidovorax sp. Be4]MCT9812075.1 AAA family ATPase [Acidovorax sp. Be4]
MKIAIISPNPAHLQEMAHALQEHSHQVQTFEGGKTRMPTIAEQERPDLMLVDGMCCDPADLAPVEYVTTHYTRTAVVLLCAQQTPEFLLQSMRAGVREVLNSPASPQSLVDAVRRIGAKLQDSTAERPKGRIMAFLSCKGGSGATFLTTNLGWMLARNHSVLIMDLNLQFGDALGYLHEGKPASTLADVARDIRRLDASFLTASTVKVTPRLHVLAAPEDAMHAMEVDPLHVDAILQLAAAHYEFVLLDMGRVLDPLALRVLDRAQIIAPVLLPNVPAVRNAQKLLRMFRDLGYSESRLHPVLNRVDRRSEIGLPEVSKTLGLAQQWHSISEATHEVQAAINAGVPLAESSRGSTVVRELTAWADVLSPQAHEEGSGILTRLFRRA